MELNIIERIHLIALLETEIEDERKLLDLWIKEKNYQMIQITLNNIFLNKNMIKKLDY